MSGSGAPYRDAVIRDLEASPVGRWLVLPGPSNLAPQVVDVVLRVLAEAGALRDPGDAESVIGSSLADAWAERDVLRGQVTAALALIHRTIDTVEDFDDATVHSHDDPTEGDPECSACWLRTLADVARALGVDQ